MKRRFLRRDGSRLHGLQPACKYAIIMAKDKTAALFALPYDADDPVLLRKGSYRGIAVIDREWVYLQEENRHFYRIIAEGKDYEKVF